MDTTRDRLTRFSFLGFKGGALLIAINTVLAQTPAGDQVWKRLIEEAYSKHVERVREALPAHSGLPPTLDLSKPPPVESAKDLAWERGWKGIFAAGTFTDPGMRAPSEATSIATTFQDGAYAYDLPARACDTIAIATPVAIEERIDRAHSFVYSKSSLKTLQVLKGKKASNTTILAINFGGSIRFASGHLETFILAGHGFLEVGKEYLLFLWKPHRAINTYIVAQAYLISGNVVFPINSISNQSTYDGMQFKKFETIVKDSIARNTNTD